MSQKFMDKFVKEITKQFHPVGFFRSIYYHFTHGRYRNLEDVTRFVNRQIRYPNKDIKKLALHFFKKYDDSDERIVAILKYATQKFTYVSDQSQFGKVERWLDADELLETKKGDCEDINGFIYVVARLALISHLQLWNALGSVKGGGHYWLLYFSFDSDRWVTIDGTYWVDRKPVSKRPSFKFNIKKYKSIWYLFNDFGTYKMR